MEVERKKICRRHVFSSPRRDENGWLAPLLSHTSAPSIMKNLRSGSTNSNWNFNCSETWISSKSSRWWWWKLSLSRSSRNHDCAPVSKSNINRRNSSSTQSSFQQTLSQDSHKSPWTTTATLPLLLDPVDDSKSCLRLVACRRHQQQTPTPTLWWCTLQPQAMTRPPHRYCSVANE